MLKVSSRSTYAIRALIQLGREYQKGPVRLSTVAERQNIPLPYLEQIFAKLRKAGLVEAERGPQGGYQLARAPQDITLAEVVTHLEGPMAPVLCSMPENRSDECHEVDGCASRLLCNELDGELSRILNRHTLGNLCGEAERLAPTQIPLRAR